MGLIDHGFRRLVHGNGPSHSGQAKVGSRGLMPELITPTHSFSPPGSFLTKVHFAKGNTDWPCIVDLQALGYRFEGLRHIFLFQVAIRQTGIGVRGLRFLLKDFLIFLDGSVVIPFAGKSHGFAERSLRRIQEVGRPRKLPAPMAKAPLG